MIVPPVFLCSETLAEFFKYRILATPGTLNDLSTPRIEAGRRRGPEILEDDKV